MRTNILTGMILFSFLLVLSINNRVNGQASDYHPEICDNGVCSNLIPSLFRKVESNAVVLKQQAIEKRKQLKAAEVVFDLNCEYPSFWNFVIKQNKKFKKIEQAKALGVAIRIDRESSCDVNKVMLAVPIYYSGDEHWAVTGFDGDPVFMDNAFITLITNPDFWCEGLPIEPTDYHTCSLCGGRYSSQRFKSKVGDKITETNYFSPGTKGGCSVSSTKNHDNLTLVDNQGCVKSEGSKFIRK